MSRMVEQENVKVYELAKELGLESFALVDKLNSLNIKVKSHMSELGPEEVKIARASLGKKTEVGGTAKKPGARTRKKVETAPAGASITAPPSTAAQKPLTAKPTAAQKVAMAEPESAQAPRSATPIIRRRGSAGGDAPASTTSSTSGLIRHAEVSTDSSTRGAYAGIDQESDELEASESMAPSEFQEMQEEGMDAADDSSASDLETSGPFGSETGETEESSLQSAASADANGAGTSAHGMASQFGASTSMSQANPETTSPAVKTRAPVVLPPRPVAPRRSILKIVEPAAPPARPMIRPVGSVPTTTGPKITPRGAATPGTPDRDGFRIIKMDKGSLDEMVAEEAAKKRGVGREAEIKPEDVRFADYRKKEMVFLPKRKRMPIGKELKRTEKTTMKAAKRFVEMGAAITIQDFAAQLGVKGIDVVRKLMQMGQMVNINSTIDFDTATLVGTEFQYEVRNVSFKEEEFLDDAKDAAEALQTRPPIVTIMGHVDHGKTSLLDAIRQADVAGGEAGGITQHIGAYTVEQNGQLITFVDTPGHEAFTAMRARGANVTDIVILVVAADDGVMPQTREALSHAQAAGVPIIVAMNKIDKPQANPEKIKQQLSELNLLAEEWGGQTMFVPVSAIKKTGLDKLLEAVLLQAEVLDLKANPEARASGTILEARMEKGRGPVTSVLIKRGTLRIGDSIVSGRQVGRVKALHDDKGRSVKEVLPGIAAEVLGFEALPMAGEKFDSPEDDTAARKIAENRIDIARATALATSSKGGASLEELFAKVQAGAKELNVILKADVFGSAEAIRESLIKCSTEKVKVKVIYSAPGGISESDVLLASASGAIILGFNVRPETKARQTAEAAHVEIKSYSIIYELIDDIKKSMVGLLDKKKVEKFLGRAEVRQTFSVPKIGMVAGSSVIDGKIIRGANVRLLRESRIIYEGKMSSLRRFKDDAKEVATGFECGIGLENYNDLKPGDIIEAYTIEMVTPELGA